MINMNLHQAASLIGGTLVGKAIQFIGVSTDSRQDCKQKLFIALKGPHFNGEDHCQQALDNGAVAVLVSEAQDLQCPQIICGNTLDGLTVLAKNWCKQCQVKVIAITGSNGKTTVKNMVQSIISVKHTCSATEGNLNNEIGVPLTLCKIKNDDQYAVIEMGAAKLGDIKWLSSLLTIHSAAITNVSAAHIGRFESFANIIHEKGEIVADLAENSHAILPIDDQYYSEFQNRTAAKILSFGANENADIRIEDDTGFNLNISGQTITDIQLPVAGRHNQANAACAAALAYSCSIDGKDIKAGLENFMPAPGRLQNLGKINGNIIIDDSYNANPQSVKAAIDVLCQYPSPTTLVFADMAELGDEAKALHAQIGNYAKQHNISKLLTYGQHSYHSSVAFAQGSEHFDKLDELKNHMLKNWNKLGVILFKGSRSMHLENLISRIIDSEKAA
jgi:UDP-N-acetylmuramoyl-tripeptide--D-alanyl-D-alanine ligase